jgi:hypothetical protein
LTKKTFELPLSREKVLKAGRDSYSMILHKFRRPRKQRFDCRRCLAS